MDVGAAETVGRVALALTLGALIGLERELDTQPAGFRTHVLVALGAALFTLAGAEVTGSDPTRVAAQVASGVGFLGAGVILRESGRVHGLTTAASLWVTASVGLAAGFGRWFAAVTVTVAALVVLTVLKQVERRWFPERRGHPLAVEVADGVALAEVVAAVQGVAGRLDVRKITTGAGGGQQILARANLPQGADLVHVVEQLRRVSGVRGVDLGA